MCKDMLHVSWTEPTTRSIHQLYTLLHSRDMATLTVTLRPMLRYSTPRLPLRKIEKSLTPALLISVSTTSTLIQAIPSPFNPKFMLQRSGSSSKHLMLTKLLVQREFLLQLCNWLKSFVNFSDFRSFAALPISWKLVTCCPFFKLMAFLHQTRNLDIIKLRKFMEL